MQKGSPRNLGDLAGDLFRTRQKQPHLTVTLLRKHWAGILGAELASKTHPARIAGNTLWINALDSSWAFQLQFLKEEILPAIQVNMRGGHLPPPEDDGTSYLKMPVNKL